MPFAGYKDFADCVRKNQDKSDPEAYCSVIMRRVEGDTKKKKAAIKAAGEALKR